MFEIAIIGASGSGKSDLALNLAIKKNALILSLDSLSIYKEIDIVSAKPSKDELNLVKHFGVDVIYPNESFSVKIFFDIYKEAKAICQSSGKNLIIVGGTSFYLKAMLDGLSDIVIDDDVKRRVQSIKKDDGYAILSQIDKEYAYKISPNDSYRIEKALCIYYQYKSPPSEVFETHRKEPIIEHIDIFEIDTPKETLKLRVAERTKKMIKSGLIDEVFYLESRYTREPIAMKSIGIKESFEYLDGRISLSDLEIKISLNTLKLAKRQKTFNRTQLTKVSDSLFNLEKRLLELL
jgi:tRNA dimethylallyltransferase